MIHEDEEFIIDFSWLLFIGHCLLGFSEKEVGRMTLKKLLSLYEHYKNNYDFKLKQITYAELEEKINHQGELFSDE